MGELLESYFNQEDLSFPHPVGAAAAIPPRASSLTNQSTSILTNGDSAFWLALIRRIWSPPLQEDRDEGRGLLAI